jgi:hypothetical protein
VRTSPKTVVEQPYGFVGRTAGKSKMNLAEALGFLKQLWDLSRFNAGRGAGRPRHLVVEAEYRAHPERVEGLTMSDSRKSP